MKTSGPWMYCKTKDGRKMVVFSDNTKEETMHLFAVDQLEDFDADFLRCEVVKYSDIVRIDRNEVVAYL